MAIGQSKLHEIVRRRRLLSESLVWYNSFDSNLKTTMLDWIRNDQLRNRGVDADGEVIGYYTAFTASINPIKKFNTHYTLEDTGEFYRSMFVIVLSDHILFEANSQSYNEMQDQDWFNNRILNLTDENIQLLKGQLKEKYIAAVRKALLGD